MLPGTQPYQPQSQRGWHDLWLSQARNRLIGAHDTLAARLGKPAFDRASRRPQREVLELGAIGDLELTATVAEAVVDLAARVDALQARMDAQEGQGS